MALCSNLAHFYPKNMQFKQKSSNQELNSNQELRSNQEMRSIGVDMVS